MFLGFLYLLFADWQKPPVFEKIPGRGEFTTLIFSFNYYIPIMDEIKKTYPYPPNKYSKLAKKWKKKNVPSIWYPSRLF